MLVDRGQTHRPMAEKEDKRGLQALAERSTGRRLMLSLVRSSIMSAAPQALEERRMVDTANVVEEDNTKPVTSAAVYVEIGNIEALLASL